MRWVKRNEDKPHRCPECHAIPARCRSYLGPRTAVSCPLCRVKWRMGVRFTAATDRYIHRVQQHPAWPQRLRRAYEALERSNAA